MVQGHRPAISGILRLIGFERAAPSGLRAGETVSVRVVGEAGPGRWTVIVRGRTMSAASELRLSAGELLSARVEQRGSSLLLRLQSDPGDLGRALAASRLPADAASRAAARALLASGLGVTLERLDRLRFASRGPEEGSHRRLRAAAEALRKLPDATAADVEELVAAVQPAGDASEGGSRGRRDRRRAPEHGAGEATAEAVRRALWGDPEEPTAARGVGLLRLFNHTTATREEWVVLPCRLSLEDGRQVEGSVRVRYDTASRAIRALVLGASVDGGPEWWFRLAPEPAGLVCRAWSDDPRGADPAALADLGRQLGNLGVRCADTVGDGASFDGFSMLDERHPVDIVG